MNREQRRQAERDRHRRAIREGVRAHADRHGACPDCDAHLTIRDDGSGVLVAEVRHDDTCPAYRAMGGPAC